MSRFFSALCLSFIAVTIQAAATLEGITLGNHISGPKLAEHELDGRVVFFEYWGVNCPPCRSSIKHLVALKEELGEGVTMIANHCQRSSPDGIRRVWSENGGNENITVIDGGSLPDANVRGIPRAFVFDHTGKLVFDGHPMRVDEALRAAVEAAPGALLGERDWAHLAVEAKIIGKLQQPARKAMKSVRMKLKSRQAEVAAEAADMLAAIETWAGEELAQLTELQQSDPLASWLRVQQVSDIFKGDDVGDPFDDRVKELKRDKEFRREIEAAVALEKLRAAVEQGDERVKAKCRVMAQKLADKYEGTQAATQAMEQAATW